MHNSIDLDLEEIESRLYSQVYHSTEKWDQTPDHPVLNKVPERQITTYCVSKFASNSTRYWDAHTESKSPNINENTVINDVITKPIQSTSKPSDIKTLINDNDNLVKNNHDRNKVNKISGVEEYIDFDMHNSARKRINKQAIQSVSNYLRSNLDQDPCNSQLTQNTSNIDFSKDDVTFGETFICNPQNKLIQQRDSKEINNSIGLNNIEPGSFISNNNSSSEVINSQFNSNNNLEQTDTSKLTKKKLKKIKQKERKKQIKLERQKRRFRNYQAREERRLIRFGLSPTSISNILGSFTLLQFNNLKNKKHSILSPINLLNCPRVNKREDVKKVSESVVILSDTESDNDDVVEIPMDAAEIVCVDTSSEESDTEDNTVCIGDNIVENISKINTTDNLSSNLQTAVLITEDCNVPKLENSSDCETIEITSELHLNSNKGVINEIKEKQTFNIEEDKKEETELIPNIKENTQTSENEEITEDNKLSDQKQNISKKTSISEIEKERTELLCTPDSNTNDFMAHDVSNLNKNMFTFNFNLHDSDLNISGKEISKDGPSITDIYETESSCSEAGTSTKNPSYFNEVDFDNPIKEIFAEPDLAKFSSFITPIRNRNNFNDSMSNSILSPIKTKAGVMDPASFQLDVFQNSVRNVSYSSDEYNSDSTALLVKKKVKKKKKKVKKKDCNEATTEIETEIGETNKSIILSTFTEKECSNKSKKIKKKIINTEENSSEMLNMQENLANKNLSKFDISNIELSKEIEKSIIKSKDSKLKQKNKRKSNKMDNELENNSSIKKNKNIMSTSESSDVSKNTKNVDTANKNYEKNDTSILLEENHDDKIIKPSIDAKNISISTNVENTEPLLKIASKTIEKINSADDHDKVSSYFADDMLYEDLKNKEKQETNSLKINKISTENLTTNQIAIDKDNSSSEIIDIDTISNSSPVNIEFSFVNSFLKSHQITGKNEILVKNSEQDEIQTIDISSDSETETMPENNALPNENTSSNNANDIVLNIFSSDNSNINETSKTEQNLVANPFSFENNHNKRFKDFWTNDMNLFYNSSWGQEDYDLPNVQQTMPSDFSKWSINVADQFPVKRKRGPMCMRCREYGHLQFQCPNRNDIIKCVTCGENEHTTTRCPNSICTTCRRSTQHHTTSCHNCSNYRNLHCPICNYVGHLPRDCPDLWRRYHLTTSDTNTLITTNQMMKPPNLLWCSNCANQGHTSNNCIYLRTDHFTTNPGIHSYTPVYNNAPLLHQIPLVPEIPVRIFQNVNLSRIRNYRTELTENNNKKYINMIKKLRRQTNINDINISERLNHLQSAATNNRFNKRKVAELYKISKYLRNSR